MQADTNEGGRKQFVVGPWQPSYELGTCGVDPATSKAWAVVNHDGEFAIVRQPGIAL